MVKTSIFARVLLPSAQAGLLALALLAGAAQAHDGNQPADQAPAAQAAAPAAAAAGDQAPGVRAPLAPCPATAGIGAMPMTTPAQANGIRERVAQRMGGVPVSVCRMPFGLFEVVVDGEVLYVDERANYLIAGNAFDLRTQENLTARRKEDVLRVDFKTLPFDKAVKTVRGDGTRVMAVFEDPNCPYCKRFEKDMASLSNTTIYTFLYPILSRDQAAPDDSYPKSRAIWCAPDRAAAWSQLMLEGRHLAAAAENCQHPLEDVLALGQKLHITGTPTIVFTDGRRAPGAIPLERVEQMMAEASHPPVSK